MKSKTAVFTIVSLNYGAYARTLMESVRAVHPEWDRYALLVDRCDEPADVGGELFSTMLVEDLPLPKKCEFLFRYEIMELNTAVKPYMFAQLRRQGYERVIYIDPDILLFDRLADVERLLDEGASAVVTPHLTAPLDDGCRPSEFDIMRVGAYNLGFLAVSNLPASDAFIAWWQDKLEYGAISDQERGLFTDQKWVDMAPGMFGGFALLRDPGYNVAYWNLPHRRVTRENGVWSAGGSRLRFFHFSGFDPLNPKPFSKHQNRFTLANLGEASKLATAYAAKLLGHRYQEFRTHPYAFGRFDDGTPIPGVIRGLYRDDDDLRARAGENPFASGALFTHGVGGGMPIILRALWMRQPYLQRCFPDPLGSSRAAFYRWFTRSGASESGIPEAFVPPVSCALAKLPAASGKLMDLQSVPADRMSDDASVWARGLAFLHRRANGGVLSAARKMQYQQVTGPVQFFRLCMQQLQGARWAPSMSSAMLVANNNPDPMQTVFVAGSIVNDGIAKRNARRRGERYFGLYPEPGQTAWWVARRARFAVERFNGTSVRIRGTHFGDLHQRAHGQKNLHIAVGFDDEPRRTVNISPGRFDIQIDLETLPSSWPAVLHLVPDASFVPSEIGLSQDSRRLSVQISSIDMGDVAIFSAERPADVHPANAVASSGADAEESAGMPGVNVIGYAHSEHGLGQSLRQFAAALDAARIPCAVMDFNQNNSSRIEDRSLESRIVAEPEYGINVFHINADQMYAAEMTLSAHVFSRYNIGFWHWELPEMLDEHLAGFALLNEVWAPTAFVQDAVAKKSPVPVVRMPHAIHFTISAGANRAQFGLPEDKFLFLMMYDFSSYQERKNPQAALEAFDQAFANGNSNVALVIKTQNAQFHHKDVEALRSKIAERGNVIWINETLSRQQVYDLQSVCDALVSLHRSEGFGLGPAEAMFLGKPVIATNWSGNTEFMRSHNSLPVNYRLVTIEKDVGVYRAGQTWAEPDIAHAASLMRRIVADGELRANISAEAKRTMVEEFSPKAIGRRIGERLAFIQQNLPLN